MGMGASHLLGSIAGWGEAAMRVSELVALPFHCRHGVAQHMAVLPWGCRVARAWADRGQRGLGPQFVHDASLPDEQAGL